MEGDILKIVLTGNGTISRYDIFSLDDPTRLVIDVFEITKIFQQRLIEINSPYIYRIRIGIHPDKVRLCLDSSEEELPPYHIVYDDNRLVIVIGEVQKSEEKGNIGATGGPYTYYPIYMSSPTSLTSRLGKNPIVLQGHAEGRL